MPTGTGIQYESKAFSTALSAYLDSDAAGVTLDAGHRNIPAVAYTGANINAALTEVADITDPSGWTDIVSIDLGEPIAFAVVPVSSTKECYIEIDSVEDAGDAIRLQIRDTAKGITLFDTTCVKDAANVINYWQQHGYYGGVLGGITTVHSLNIRACRHGSFADNGTLLYVGTIYYSKLGM